MRKNDILVGAVLQTLEIEDKFHGYVSYSCRYLARSYITQESKVKAERNLKEGAKQLTSGSGSNSWKQTGSSKPKLTPQDSSGDERFFDANESGYESGYESSSSTFSLHRRDSSSSDMIAKFYDAQGGEEDDHDEPPSFKREVGLLPGSAYPSQEDDSDVTNSNEELKSFVKAQAIMTSPKSPMYASIDKEVS